MPQKRHAPPELQSLIDLANSVSPNVELPPPMGRVEEVVQLLKTDPFKRFRELTGPIEADTFLTKLLGPDAPKTYNKVMGNYIRLRDGRAWLRQAAAIGKMTLRMRYMMPNVSAYIDERGLIEFNIDPLVKVLQGVEVDRIRVCPICEMIYWAARRDKPCCSVRCAKMRRTRLWREGYEMKFRDQRSGKNNARRKLKEQREREKLAKLNVPSAEQTGRPVRLPTGAKEQTQSGAETDKPPGP